MPRPFRQPRPNFFLMWILGFVSRWVFLRAYFRIRSVDLPGLDWDRLSRAVNKETAAFIGPNHPEFGFDWIMDKEVSTWIAPRMASWASHEIIETAPGFWARNNLIGNNGGEAATEYSVGWALRGDGVLLHPEGAARWNGDHVHPLFQGIAEMACEAAHRAGNRPVFIVPIVWKLRFVGDVSAGLHHDMKIIERHLGLPAGSSGLGDRFRGLQEGILERQMLTFGFNPRAVVGLDFFARQDAFRDWLIEKLEQRHEVEESDSVERTITRYRRAITMALRESPAADDRRRSLMHDRDIADEAARLLGYSAEAYGGRWLTQEQIAESLKRHRAALVKGGLRNTLHNFLPRPRGWRVAHVRVPEPIRIDPRRCGVDDRKSYVTQLIGLARRRMQDALETVAINGPTLANPFARVGVTATIPAIPTATATA